MFNLASKVPKYLKMFGKAQVELTLALGTLVASSVSVEEDFQQLAYFTTRVGLQNTTHEENNFKVKPDTRPDVKHSSPESNSKLVNKK